MRLSISWSLNSKEWRCAFISLMCATSLFSSVAQSYAAVPEGSSTNAVSKTVSKSSSALGVKMKSDSPQAILHELESFRQMGSVLYIAAHPDDENTELLAYLARGRNYRTAYLSLTRGDGGQNVLGADLGAKLGVARTQELLAARQID